MALVGELVDVERGLLVLVVDGSSAYRWRVDQALVTGIELIDEMGGIVPAKAGVKKTATTKAKPRSTAAKRKPATAAAPRSNAKVEAKYLTAALVEQLRKTGQCKTPVEVDPRRFRGWKAARQLEKEGKVEFAGTTVKDGFVITRVRPKTKKR